MTAPTFAAAGGPPKDDWSDLDDTSLVPTGKTARELDHGDPAPGALSRAYIDTAARVSLGSRASTEKTVNQVAQFKCDACGGSGRWYPRFSYSHMGGPCRKCKGTGKLKTDPEKRAKQKKARETRKKAALGEYIAAHASEFAWATASMRTFGFAASMIEALQQHGSWTDGQLAAIRKCMTRDQVRAQEKAARKPDAQVAGGGLDRMLQAFAAASKSGLRNPKFRVGNYAFSPAKPGSANAGCIYVKRDGVYVGRITPAGEFFASRDAVPDDRGQIEKICADPLAAAVLHGQQTGRCSCCGLELTNAESIRLGIGPICREKWGL